MLPSIRPAHAEDLALLDTYLPPVDNVSEHHDRLRSQTDGTIDYLIAWLGELPAGHVIVRWTGFKFGPLPRVFPDIPVLVKLRVWPPERWGMGIGTALIEAAERAAIERGHDSIGLGVEIDNDRARRLYDHLGYVDWGGGALRERTLRLGADDRQVPYDEVFTVMTKTGLQSRAAH